MRRFGKVFAILLIMMTTFSGIAISSPLIRMETVASFKQQPMSNGISGDLMERLFSLNNTKLKLKPNLFFSGSTITGGYVEMVDGISGKKIASFTVEKWPYFRAKKLVASTGEEFLFVQAGKVFASESSCTNIWLVGLHKGAYVIFATTDTVKNAGLLYTDITSSLEDGELKLLGFTRDRNCINGTYKGHLAYPIGGADYGINSTYLFWDEHTQWFGIRKAD